VSLGGLLYGLSRSSKLLFEKAGRSIEEVVRSDNADQAIPFDDREAPGFMLAHDFYRFQ
jgi:hypothetical protein